MTKTSGRLTLPSENNFLKETEELISRLGADAIRDSDGTKLDEETLSLPVKVYSTYFVARGHNEFAKEHMEECQQFNRIFPSSGNPLYGRFFQKAGHTGLSA